MKHQVAIQSDPRWSEFEQALLEAAERTLEQEAKEQGAITIVLADEVAIRDLNKTFAGEDYATDVLSFIDGSVHPESSHKYFGDVIIAVDIADDQALKAGHSLAVELCLLTVHGVLHLLGHDHADPDQKDLMWTAQSSILESLGITLGQGKNLDE